MRESCLSKKGVSVAVWWRQQESSKITSPRLPFEVVVKDGLEARPQQHVDAIEKAVKHRDSSSLHDHRVSMGDLDHEEKPDAIAAVGEVALEVLDAQGQRPRENLIKRILRLPLGGSRSNIGSRGVNDIVHPDPTCTMSRRRIMGMK